MCDKIDKNTDDFILGEIYSEFIEKSDIRLAVEELLKEADELAKSNEGQIPFEELFGEDD